jgi:hypothetical protein
VPNDDLLPDVAHAARLQIRRWAKLHDRRVTSSRGAHIATHEHVKLQVRNAASMVHSTLVNGHPVISLFTSELSIGFARWMGMNVIVSALMAMLVVRWQRQCLLLPRPDVATNCCDPLRTQRR